MNDVILKVENLSKQYRLGIVGTRTISHDFNRFLARIRGKEDPYLKIGESNDRSIKGESEYVWALKDINFEVKRGEVLGIIGKNGAGKSTLLKILSKVTGPTKGCIKSNGRIASLLEVGTGFHPEMTGKENIFLNGAILGMTKKEISDKLDEIVSFSGCERYIDTPVKRYSSGMKVRLAFAVAAHLEPDILIVDEVLAVGDAEFQKKAIGKMQDISNEGGRTVLFVSHNMAAIKNLCTRTILLDKGEITYEGTTNETIDFYLNTQHKKANELLSKRTDRSGSGEVRFTQVELLNHNGNYLTEIISGDYARFRLHFVFNKNIPPEDLIFGLVIYDNNEVKIADFYSDEMGRSFKNIKTYVDLELPKLMLRGGDYSVVIVVQRLKPVFQQIDLVHNVLNFKVFSGDFWNVGKVNRPSNVAIIKGEFLIK
jgi:lipopolysaccharide transport system ATP-binding protein